MLKSANYEELIKPACMENATNDVNTNNNNNNICKAP